jgi:hypothetical protein
LAVAVLALLAFAIAPHWLLHWLLPSGADSELRWSWWQQAVGDSYALIGLAFLTYAAIKVLLLRPNRWGPGTAATTYDQELEPVPSPTRDDARVSART